MLDVRVQDGVFVLFDTDLGQVVVRFTDSRSADQRAAERQANELRAALQRWAPTQALALP